MNDRHKYFTIVSLGCPKNLVDSERFMFIFRQYGFTYTEKPEKADIILINTCGFIKDAQEEAINTILEISEYKKKLIVTGCLVKRFKDDLVKEIPEVDVWLDLKDFEGLRLFVNSELTHPVPSSHVDKSSIIHKTKLLDLGEGNSEFRIPNSELRGRGTLTPSHYAYLRISDGCDNKCSYCTIPSIRGSHTSEKIEDLISEAKYLAEKGVQELIITAQDTTLYGQDIYKKQMLITLLTEIENLNLFRWIRLLYLHPAHLTEEIIVGLTGLKTLLPYFDIPLQHISTEILDKMNRKIDKETIINRLNYLREKFPTAAIRTTFITGFPGETKLHFKELENFIKEFKFTRLGVFTYSLEEGTPAYDLPNKVSKQTAQRRKDKLMSIQQDISAEIMRSYIGQTIEVIVDEHKKPTPTDKRDSFYSVLARSYNDAPEIDGNVYIAKSKAKPGDIVKVKITEALMYDLIGVECSQ